MGDAGPWYTRLLCMCRSSSRSSSRSSPPSPERRPLVPRNRPRPQGRLLEGLHLFRASPLKPAPTCCQRPGCTSSHRVTPLARLPVPADPSGEWSWREAMQAVTPCAGPATAPCLRRHPESPRHGAGHNSPAWSAGPCLCRCCALCQEGLPLLPLQAAEVPPQPSRTNVGTAALQGSPSPPSCLGAG